MAAKAVGCSLLETFRAVWVRGHLDCQRAVEALEAAIESAKQVRRADASLDEHEVQKAHQNVESARDRLAEIQAMLAAQFDRFCGLPT
jgi:multidrug resistance efflux pump